MKKILTVSTLIMITVSFLTIFTLPNKKEENNSLSSNETTDMLSYTLNGEKIDEKPTKESGYIANKIECDNNSNLIWDNDSWEIQIIKMENIDRCTIDFTKSESTLGARVKAVSNIPNGLDSNSKTTTDGGEIIFYPIKGKFINSVSGCNAQIEENNVKVSNVTSNVTCNIEVYDSTLYNILTKKYEVDSARNTNTTEPIEGTEIKQKYTSTGKIYMTAESSETEDGTTTNPIYYFAGNPSDNWVKFAGYYFRIIRTDATHGVKLLYAGSSPETTEGYIKASKVGASDISDNGLHYENAVYKNDLESWYEETIGSKYNSLISTTAKYCNDTSMSDSVFGVYTRLITNKTPTYKCPQESDNLSIKAGLMTADEVAFAGGVYGKNAPNTYYYRNSINGRVAGLWWTFSPGSYSAGKCGTYAMSVGANGNLGESCIDSDEYIRPVITLAPSAVVKGGTGTDADPFTIEGTDD